MLRVQWACGEKRANQQNSTVPIQTPLGASLALASVASVVLDFDKVASNSSLTALISGFWQPFRWLVT
jgi:hypothetical protein